MLSVDISKHLYFLFKIYNTSLSLFFFYIKDIKLLSMASSQYTASIETSFLDEQNKEKPI